MAPVDLVASGTLPRAWADRAGRSRRPCLLRGRQRWAAPATAGERPLPGQDRPGRWWTAGEFESATRQVAGRLRGAGLVPGDRVVWSTASSVAALVAHVGALRAGLVVVPANTAYTERELAHIVADVRPAAAIVDAPSRRTGCGGPRPARWWWSAPTSTCPTATPGL